MQMSTAALGGPPVGIPITGMSSVEGGDLCGVIRVNELVMEMQIRATSIISSTPPHQGGFYKQPGSLIEM